MASTLLYEGRHLSTNWKRRQRGQKFARKWRRERNWKLTFSTQPSVIQRAQASWMRFSAPFGNVNKISSFVGPFKSARILPAFVGTGAGRSSNPNRNWKLTFAFV